MNFVLYFVDWVLLCCQMLMFGLQYMFVVYIGVIVVLLIVVLVLKMLFVDMIVLISIVLFCFGILMIL